MSPGAVLKITKGCVAEQGSNPETNPLGFLPAVGPDLQRGAGGIGVYSAKIAALDPPGYRL